MTARGWTHGSATKRPIIVIAGEDSTDRKAIGSLLQAFCTDANGRIVEINDTIRLSKANDASLQTRVRKLAGSVRARAERERAAIACVFVHEDLDMMDSDKYVVIRRRVQQALSRELDDAHYVLAVWEIEAWMLLFPEALKQFSASWKAPARYRGVDTGRIADPKRVMRDEVSKDGPSYRVSDCPRIFDKIAQLELCERPTGSNRSYSDFRSDATRCCGRLSK